MSTIDVKQPFDGWTVEGLEPGAIPPAELGLEKTFVAQISVAISLKRIADTLEGVKLNAPKLGAKPFRKYGEFDGQ